jgi:hypothetical protein
MRWRSCKTAFRILTKERAELVRLAEENAEVARYMEAA